jgi:predicted nucleic acid-binding protein
VTFVLDASIAACWYFQDEHDPRATRALRLLEHEDAIVPLHWWFEIRNVVVMGERRGRASQSYTEGYLSRLEEYPIAFDALQPDRPILTLARRHSLTFYDAAYLGLAVRRKLRLASLDKELIAAARAEGIALIE